MLGEVTSPQVAQAGVQLGFGLSRAADVELFEHLWDAAEHQDHAAFERRGQNCLHRVPPSGSGPHTSGLAGSVKCASSHGEPQVICHARQAETNTLLSPKISPRRRGGIVLMLVVVLVLWKLSSPKVALRAVVGSDL